MGGCLDGIVKILTGLFILLIVAGLAACQPFLLTLGVC